MSDFLLIVPSGWDEIPSAETFFTNHMTADTVNLAAQEGTLWDVTSALENFGVMVSGMMVGDARAFHDGAAYRLWVTWVPEA